MVSIAASKTHPSWRGRPPVQSYRQARDEDPVECSILPKVSHVQFRRLFRRLRDRHFARSLPRTGSNVVVRLEVRYWCCTESGGRRHRSQSGLGPRSPNPSGCLQSQGFVPAIGWMHQGRKVSYSPSSALIGETCLAESVDRSSFGNRWSRNQGCQPKKLMGRIRQKPWARICPTRGCEQRSLYWGYWERRCPTRRCQSVPLTRSALRWHGRCRWWSGLV